VRCKNTVFLWGLKPVDCKTYGGIALIYSLML